MNRTVLPLVAAVLLAAVGSAAAMDQLIRTEGPAIGGKLLEMTPLKVKFEQNGKEVEVDVNQVQAIQFDGENTAMKTVRKHVQDGRYEEALAILDKLDKLEVSRKEVGVDMKFYRAMATARLALAGTGTIRDAGKLMFDFATENPTSYHFLEAAEVLGQLLALNGNYAKAAEYYQKLADAPWPEYKMRAGVALGRCLVAEQKYAEAAKAYQGVLALSAKGEAADQARAAASLGVLRCQVETGKPDEVVAQIEKVIADTSPEQKDVMAQAYNILGSALRKLQRNEDATMAFLHVDLLYSSVPEAHAEALANLIDLWSLAQQAERAARCRQILKERYPNSAWAQKG